MDLKSTYNKIAGDWFDDHKEDTWWKPSVGLFTAFLTKGDTVLDVGCGPGITSKYLQSKGLHVLGIDFSEEFILIAKKETPSADFRVVDLHSHDDLKSLPRVKGILAKAVFLHMEKKKVLDILKTLCEHLKCGGYFYIAVKEKKPQGSEEEVLKENDYGYTYERFFSYYTLSEVQKLFKECDLKVVHDEIFTPHKTSWVIVIGQK
ncbi:MAG: class I SAM-dependent methyltransferase [Candidatus Taylorbacteria bacterium]|nr:class I SAM-dependent methyltransferase [Candidatus Taylorbacteria bacterium]